MLFDDGTLVVYEFVPDFGSSAYRQIWPKTTGTRLVKRLYRNLGSAKTRPSSRTNGAGGGDSSAPAPRRLTPFGNVGGYSGLFVTGENPAWILADDAAPCHFYESTIKPVFGFSAVADPSSALQAACLMSTGQVSPHTNPSGRLESRTLNLTRVMIWAGDPDWELTGRHLFLEGGTFHQSPGGPTLQ